MKQKFLPISLAVTFVLSGVMAQAQRYATEVFSSNQITITHNVPFAANIDFLTTNITDSIAAMGEVMQLQDSASTGGNFPSQFFDPNSTTQVKLAQLKMDVYQPDQTIDTLAERPVFVYVHTGNFLPPPLNGSPTGLKTDSLAVVACTQWAMRGFVAVSIDYRLGWNPIASSSIERRATLLNAVYRALQDTKQAVRFLRADAAGSNDYHIDPNKIVLFGEGSGGYVVLAYGTIDSNSDLYKPQFINPVTGDDFVDTTMVGDYTGFNGLLNLYRPNGQSADVNMVVNAGGAMGDISWLDDTDPPMVAFHAIRDDFAPFDYGTVIVPTTQEDVVTVSGSNAFIHKADSLGNNAPLGSSIMNDPYSMAARALYGQTFDISNGLTVTVYPDNENLYPFLLPLRPFLTNVASPWQWWDQNSALAQTVIDQNGTTANMASLASNPNMSSEQGRTYLDTIQGYMIPRVMCDLGLPNSPCTSGLHENHVSQNTKVYPNPAISQVVIENSVTMMRGFKIYDITGKLVRSTAVSGNRYTLDISSLSPGMYEVKVLTDRGEGVQKLLVQP